MEFRAAGKTPFSVVVEAERCPVLGFAQILAEERARAAAPASTRRAGGRGS
jgi:hypothetical protein